MRLSKPFTFAVAALRLSSVRCLELAGARQQGEFALVLETQMAAERPVPEAYNIANPARLNITAKRDTECKNCPYRGCLNAGVIGTGNMAPFQCWTQGETVGDKK